MRTAFRKLARRAIEISGKLYAEEFHRLDVLNPCPIQPAGPAILVCNHTSGLDPILIQAAVPRFITWMMAREYYVMPSLHWAFELLETIPVDRGNRDSAAIRTAFRALDDGKLLGVFPEGRIETTRDLLPFEPGVAMLARRSGATVYPAFLDGSQRGHDMASVFTHRLHATLRFGPPIGSATSQATTEGVRTAIEMLHASASSIGQRI